MNTTSADSFQDLHPKYLERWANLYTLAKSIPNDNRFDMSQWAYPNGESACGTTACLAGHAGLHPWFRRRGLSFDEDAEEMFFRGKWAVDGGAKFFGADGDAAGYPFFMSQWDSVDCVNDIVHARKAVKAWMLKHWSRNEVNEAIRNATVRYDIDAVHRFSPWGCDR